MRNANFAEWDSATSPSVWQQTSITATTLSRLQESNIRSDPKRAIFTRKPYIFDGSSSLRATLTAAAAAGDFILRQPSASAAGILVQPLDRLSVVVGLRCSVNGNLARVRVIGLLGTTDTLYLQPKGNGDSVATNYNPHGNGGFDWSSSARDIAVTMHDGWQEFGFEVNVPIGIDSIAVRVGNGSAGAQTMDIGAVYVRELARVKAA
jgi:hypothetical protein